MNRILLSATFVLFTSFASPQHTKTVQEYQSVANSLADLNINLASDSTFKFSMRILATHEAPEEQLSFKGSWQGDAQYYELTFTGKRPKLKALFDPQYAEADEFTIRNDSTVAINKSKDSIMIWGVRCKKAY